MILSQSWGLSSEDEAVGDATSQGCHQGGLPGYWGGVPVQTSTSTQSTSVGPSGDVSDLGWGNWIFLNLLLFSLLQVSIGPTLTF